ncbi:MAG: hypothetical protein DRP01_00940 [Archaeoglobales archaeon]|nr:MAG: hypothetical protein DRP01_00940 [Archaeoglobales archaeon]
MKERIRLPSDALMKASKIWGLRETETEYIVESPNFIFFCEKLVWKKDKPRERTDPYRRFLQTRLLASNKR